MSNIDRAKLFGGLASKALWDICGKPLNPLLHSQSENLLAVNVVSSSYNTVATTLYDVDRPRRIACVFARNTVATTLHVAVQCQSGLFLRGWTRSSDEVVQGRSIRVQLDPTLSVFST